MKKALVISFHLHICFIELFSLFYFVLLLLCFFVHVLTVSYMYKTQKMPAHCCIYKLMLYINLLNIYFTFQNIKQC